MNENIISVGINEDKEIVAKKLSDYDFLAIPIVDNDNKLIIRKKKSLRIKKLLNRMKQKYYLKK